MSMYIKINHFKMLSAILVISIDRRRLFLVQFRVNKMYISVHHGHRLNWVPNDKKCLSFHLFTWFTATSTITKWAFTPPCSKNVWTFASLARFRRTSIAHGFALLRCSIVIQRATQVKKLVINVDISDTASEVFIGNREVYRKLQ